MSDIYISRDITKMNIQEIKALMEQTFWAKERSENTIIKSMENSLCYGVFKDEKLVGFGRVVTDYATVYWVCDIIIDMKHRGQGLSRKLMDSITETTEIKGLLGILATRDAHGLYEKYGFIKEPERFMIK